MLERSVEKLGRRGMLAVAGVTGAVAALALRPQEIRVVAPTITVQAPPTVTVQVPPPPPLPAPPPPPPPRPQPVSTTCARDVEHLGVPLVKAPPDYKAPVLAGAAASPDGCVIAAHSDKALYVSWDGGATFATYDPHGAIVQVAAAKDRVAVMHDDRTLGILTGAGTWTTRPAVEALMPAGEEGREQIHLDLRGKWLFESRKYHDLVAMTDDDSATWRYVTPPDGVSFTEIDVDGTVMATRAIYAKFDPDLGESPPPTLVGYRYDPRHPGWRRGALGVQLLAGWHYALELDHSWGCGSSDKLVAHGHGTEVTLTGDIREDVWPLTLFGNGQAAYVGVHNKMFQATATGLTELADLWQYVEQPISGGELAGVDAAGTAIAWLDGKVLRWSRAGGWRVLYEAR